MNEPMENSEPNKTKYKVSQGNHQYQCKLGAEWIEGSPVEKDCGGLVDEKLDMSQQPKPTDQKKITRILSVVILSLCSAETPTVILHLALRSLVQDRNRPVKASKEEGYKK